MTKRVTPVYPRWNERGLSREGRQKVPRHYCTSGCLKCGKCINHCPCPKKAPTGFTIVPMVFPG